MSDRYHCSNAARLRGDDNAATATRVDVWILVEVPGPWGRYPLHDAGLPLPVSEALRHAAKEIPRSRVVFIRRRFEARSGCRVYVVHSAPRTKVMMLDLASIDEVANVPFLDLAKGGGPVIAQPQPLVLVCTHGQRDSCCGRRGFPLYDALRHRPELDVWQCSHIGGDRFAANAIVLPWGICYGPVEPRDATALADSIQREEILLPSYRGRSTMPRLSQAAETFVRRRTGLTARDALRVLSRETLEDGQTHVRLRDTGGVRYEVVIEPFTAAESVLLTCTASDACPVVQFRMVEYRVTAPPPTHGGL
jgi:hypothetical protein